MLQHVSVTAIEEDSSAAKVVDHIVRHQDDAAVADGDPSIPPIVDLRVFNRHIGQPCPLNEVPLAIRNAQP